MKDKPHNLAVTKKRVRTFPLVTSRMLFSGIVRPRFLILSAAQESPVLLRAAQVFKKDRRAIRAFGKTVQQQQHHQAEFHFSPNIHLQFVTGPRAFKKTDFGHHHLVNNFKSHFTLLVSQLKDDLTVFTNNLHQHFGNRGVGQYQSEMRSATVLRHTTQNQRLPVARLQGPTKSTAQQEKLRLVTRQSKTISTSSHNWNTNLLNENVSPSNLAVQFNRFVLSKPLHVRTNEHFKRHVLRTILNSTTTTSRESQFHSWIHLPTNAFTSIALQLVLPKVSQTEQVENRIAQFLSRPEMTTIKQQQNSSENIVEVLRELKKLRSHPPPIPTPQLPSIEQLTSHVRTQLERELRIERERRGM
jgi:hypothetical protein